MNPVLRLLWPIFCQDWRDRHPARGFNRLFVIMGVWIRLDMHTSECVWNNCCSKRLDSLTPCVETTHMVAYTYAPAPVSKEAVDQGLQ